MGANSVTRVYTERSWLFPLLLGVQTIGAFIILRKGIPIYRQVVVDASQHIPSPQTLVLGLFAVALIQTAYWIGESLQPAMPQHSYALLAHAVLFVGRLSLIFAGSNFVVVFFAQPEGLHLAIFRLGVLLAVLFSMFCYATGLERLGRTLQEGARKKRELRSKRDSFTQRTQTPKA